MNPAYRCQMKTVRYLPGGKVWDCFVSSYASAETPLRMAEEESRTARRYARRVTVTEDGKVVFDRLIEGAQ